MKKKNKRIAYRFTHKRDPVPQLPPMAFGFHHHPTEVWLQDAHGEQHKVCDNTGEDPTCHNSVVLPVAVLDHLIYLNVIFPLILLLLFMISNFHNPLFFFSPPL